MSITQTDGSVNSFEARRRYLGDNVKMAAAAMNRAYEILKELGDVHGVAVELYESHMRGVPLTKEQAARKYARGKANYFAVETTNDAAIATEQARQAVEFAQRLTTEAAEAKRNAAQLSENI